MFGTLFNFTEPHFIFTVPHVQTSEVPNANTCSVVTVQLCERRYVGQLQLIYCLRLVYLVREVVAIHLVAVGLASWTLNLDAMALQDGCFFKNTNPIIAYRPQTTYSDANQLILLTKDNKKPTERLTFYSNTLHLSHHERRSWTSHPLDNVCVLQQLFSYLTNKPQASPLPWLINSLIARSTSSGGGWGGFLFKFQSDTV